MSQAAVPQQFFGNRYDLVRFEAELLLKFFQRR
jgi:hypothetical protein